MHISFKPELSRQPADVLYEWDCPQRLLTCWLKVYPESLILVAILVQASLGVGI